MTKEEIKNILEECYYDENNKLYSPEFFNLDKAIDLLYQYNKNKFTIRFINYISNLKYKFGELFFKEKKQKELIDEYNNFFKTFIE